MRLQLDYKLGVAERLAHEEFRSGSSLQRPAYFRQAIPSLVLCGLGLVASYKGQSVTLFAIFLLAAGVLTVDAWKKGLRWKSNLSAAVDKEPANSVQLVIDDNLAGAKWIASSAEGGLASGHRYLATFYRRGSHGYPVDPEKAAVHEAIAQRLEETAL